MINAAVRTALLERVTLYLADEISARQFEAWIVGTYEDIDDGDDPELANVLNEAERRAAEATRTDNQEQPLRRWLKQGAVQRLHQRKPIDEAIGG